MYRLLTYIIITLSSQTERPEQTVDIDQMQDDAMPDQGLCCLLFS